MMSAHYSTSFSGGDSGGEDNSCDHRHQRHLVANAVTSSSSKLGWFPSLLGSLKLRHRRHRSKLKPHLKSGPANLGRIPLNEAVAVAAGSANDDEDAISDGGGRDHHFNHHQHNLRNWEPVSEAAAMAADRDSQLSRDSGHSSAGSLHNALNGGGGGVHGAVDSMSVYSYNTAAARDHNGGGEEAAFVNSNAAGGASVRSSFSYCQSSYASMGYQPPSEYEGASSSSVTSQRRAMLRRQQRLPPDDVHVPDGGGGRWSNSHLPNSLPDDAVDRGRLQRQMEDWNSDVASSYASLSVNGGGAAPSSLTSSLLGATAATTTPSLSGATIASKSSAKFLTPDNKSGGNGGVSSVISQVFRWIFRLFRLAFTLGSALLLCLALMSAYTSHRCSVALQSRPNSTLTRELLTRDIFGQPLAVEKMASAFEAAFEPLSSRSSIIGQRRRRVKVMFLVGGSGTGKSLALSRLKMSFHVPQNAHQLTADRLLMQLQTPHDDQDGPQQQSSISIDLVQMVKRSCGQHLILIDDFRPPPTITITNGKENDDENHSRRQPPHSSSHSMDKLISLVNDLASSTAVNNNNNNTGEILVVVATSFGADMVNSEAMEDIVWRASKVSSNKVSWGMNVMEEETYNGLSQRLANHLHFPGKVDNHEDEWSVVPFLPLSRETVRRCVVKSVALRNQNDGQLTDDSRNLADQVIKSLEFFSQETPVFSTSGCKKVDAKVDMLLYEDY